MPDCVITLPRESALEMKILVMQPIAILEQQPKWVLTVEGLVLWMLVGVGDYFVTHRLLLEFSVFFLLPVSFFSWFMGGKAGSLISVLSAAVVLAANLTSYAYSQYPRVGAWNALIWLIFFLVVAAIIRELRIFHTRLQRLSRVDSLTGVSNRMAFNEFAEAEKNRARRDNLPLTIAYVDVDHFKEINDRLGHAAGDNVLVLAAQTMQTHIRHTDAVARIGGDEFALLLPNTRQESAKILLDKLSQLLMANMKEKGWSVTFSIGAVTFRRPPESLVEMIEHADRTMYMTKTSGRNGIMYKDVAA
jgi:diguanylate cyclase (GGDEF)-like protein